MEEETGTKVHTQQNEKAHRFSIFEAYISTIKDYKKTGKKVKTAFLIISFIISFLVIFAIAYGYILLFTELLTKFAK